MATEEDVFFNLGPGPADKSGLDVSELDEVPVARTTIKPSKYNTNTSKVAPIVKQELVEIDDELFKKILFFTLFDNAIFFDFSDRDNEINNIKFSLIDRYRFLYENQNNKKYLEITGFVETIIVFYYYLKDIDFVKYGYLTPNVKDIFNFHMISSSTFMFSIKNTAQMIALAWFDIYKCKYQLCYDKIALYKNQGTDGFPVESDKIYITQTEINTLRNYVELLEKLIAEEIVIELKDGELFANNTKIGFKNNLKNKVGKICRNTFKRAATIHMGDDNTKLYDTILSVFRNPIINAGYSLEIYDSNLCGGRNNKTRKRHRNKASHKKMRKSHNIRKRKATSKKRK